jgi:hypothetical protein
MLSRVHPLIAILMIFAVIGFLHELLLDPIKLLLIIGLSAFLFYLVYHYVSTGRFLPRIKTKKPKQNGKPTKTAMKKTGQTPRKDIPFRVIEGSKGKSKPKNEQQESKMNH